MRRVAALSLALVGAAGCADPAAALRRRATSCRRARADLVRVSQSFLGDGAAVAIAEADEALDAADRRLPRSRRRRPRPGGMPPTVAVRMVERARLAALHAADREALDHARAAVRNLAADTARREAFFADLARRRGAAADARARLSATRRAALEGACDAAEELLDRPEGLLFRLPVEGDLPAPHLAPPLGRRGAPRRARRRAPPGPPPVTCASRCSTTPTAFRAEPWHLAERRRQRICDALSRHGVPSDAFLASRSPVASGTQIDVLVIERPIAAPPTAR